MKCNLVGFFIPVIDAQHAKLKDLVRDAPIPIKANTYNSNGWISELEGTINRWSSSLQETVDSGNELVSDITILF